MDHAGGNLMAALDIVVVPIAEAHVARFHEGLDIVAREKRFLAQVQAPPLERIASFVRDNITNDVAQFVALEGDRLVGWADILPHWAPALAHRGSLGMGVLPEYRGRGIGERLLRACIAKAWTRGITRIELETRADNTAAISLYERVGFIHEATRRDGMRFDGVSHDVMAMCLLQAGP